MCEDLTKLLCQGRNHFGRLLEMADDRLQTSGEQDETPDESVAFVWDAGCLPASIQRRHPIICSEDQARACMSCDFSPENDAR